MMGEIVDLNWVRTAKNMSWIVCPCGSQKFFVMVDNEENAEMIRAVRCESCGGQVTLLEPGRLDKKHRIDEDDREV